MSNIFKFCGLIFTVFLVIWCGSGAKGYAVGNGPSSSIVAMGTSINPQPGESNLFIVTSNQNVWQAYISNTTESVAWTQLPISGSALGNINAIEANFIQAPNSTLFMVAKNVLYFCALPSCGSIESQSFPGTIVNLVNSAHDLDTYVVLSNGQVYSLKHSDYLCHNELPSNYSIIKSNVNLTSVIAIAKNTSGIKSVWDSYNGGAWQEINNNTGEDPTAVAVSGMFDEGVFIVGTNKSHVYVVDESGNLTQPLGLYPYSFGLDGTSIRSLIGAEAVDGSPLFLAGTKYGLTWPYESQALSVDWGHGASWVPESAMPSGDVIDMQLGGVDQFNQSYFVCSLTDNMPVYDSIECYTNESSYVSGSPNWFPAYYYWSSTSR